MIKQGIRIFLMMTTVLMLTGCGAKEKNLEEIKNDLQSHPNFFDKQEVSITDIEVIKRQTDKKDKSDLVFVTINADNAEIECSLSYSMTYILYNEGWMLEHVFPYEEEQWQITPKCEPSQEILNEYNEEDYVNKTIDLENGRSIYYYESVTEYPLAKGYSESIYYFDFDIKEAKWVNTDCEGSTYFVSDGLEGTWVMYCMESEAYDPFDAPEEVEYRLEISDVCDTSFYAIFYKNGEIKFEDQVEFKDYLEASIHPSYYGAPYISVDRQCVSMVGNGEVFEKIN